MSSTCELTTELAERLTSLGYDPCQAVALGADSAAVFSAQRGAKKTVCAIAPLPQDLVSPDDAVAYISQLRKAISEQFRPLPLPRRLATFTVLPVSHEQCQALRAHKGRLIDTSKWHVNVMLGIVLVDVEKFRIHSDTTWGLVNTGDHFEQIKDVADTWSARHRKPARGALAGWRLSVA